MRICKFLLTLYIFFAALPVWGAEVNIAVDKKTISDGDTIRLTIEYNGDDGNKPDISPLQQDFNIVSRSSSNYINFINGQLSQMQKWTLQLKPKKTGKITIKPIKIGNISSNYAEVEVKELTNVAYVPDSNENINSPYFQIEQSHFPSTPYVQQQLTILVTVYDSIGLQNGNMHISEDTQKDWIITPLLDKPLIKQDVINNKKMNVVTFAFAAFPQKSGKLFVPEFSFEGYYLKNNDMDLTDFNDFMAFGISFQNLMGQQVPVRMKTKKEEITVMPIPDNFTGQHWLPLKNLQLRAEISDNADFKVGDAISRKLHISATGIQQNMLPPIAFAESAAFKQYPEKPETSEQVINGDMITNATVNTVYIPVKAGKQSLPPLEIEWFNVETQRFEKSTLPAEEIYIHPNPALRQEETEPTIKPAAVAPSSRVTKDSEKPALKKHTPLLKKAHFSLEQYLIFGTGLAVLLIVIFLALRKPKNPYYGLVIKYLKNRNYKEVRFALIEWAKIKFMRPDINNFNMIAEVAQNKDFSEQLSALNKFLYSGADDFFNSAKFIENFKKIDKIRYNVQKKQKILPNLYD